MQNLTAWALAKAQDIVECEGSALVTCAHQLQIFEIEAESTLLAVAISDALLEAFSLGIASAAEEENAPSPLPKGQVI
ncbi:MAG: hypothetical protein KJ944_17835 [Alphaproteobacteria bacterium]|jgi:hypothetical protein|uniref:hypothetical protein n=1 Tax=Devosia sp. XGJD_8 TaxID=3391187 RepID=UPI001DA4C9B5|nr:hypothetical protein [Alphaproteobacteria bacterium]MBU1561942.1 hypothetical protein [Alphaproteobacteria bacterium]MBU2304453.1 hypothetical protein [Alphaproteobacteria bacterium]MBU2367674.1 hypothetical protein [Alphaproteobacteria bacterium]